MSGDMVDDMVVDMRSCMVDDMVYDIVIGMVDVMVGAMDTKVIGICGCVDDMVDGVSGVALGYRFDDIMGDMVDDMVDDMAGYMTGG